MDAKALHIVDDWEARLDIKLKEIKKAKIKEGKSKEEEKEKKKLNKTKKHEDEMKKMTVASGVGVQSEEGWRCLSEEANREFLSGKWGRFGLLSLCPFSLNVCCSQGQGQVPKGVGNYTYGGSRRHCALALAHCQVLILSAACLPTFCNISLNRSLMEDERWDQPASVREAHLHLAKITTTSSPSHVPPIHSHPAGHLTLAQLYQGIDR